MTIIGLTGGIGSGKSTILKWFEKNEIPCFESDEISRKLINTNLKSRIVEKFGLEICNPKGDINRNLLGKKVFKNPKLLESLNNIIHPEVTKAFDNFKFKHRESPIILKEAAILIESGAYKLCDIIILIKAPKHLRISRVKRRDGIRHNDVLDRMKNQWSDTKKEKFADYIIENVSLDKMYKKAQEIFEKIKK